MPRKREFDKDNVIAQAMLVFWEKGYEATSVHDLKQAMGISTSSMYETFNDKRGIFLEALAHFCELERQQLTELAQETTSDLQLVERIFDSIEQIAQNTSENYGSLAFNAMVEFGTRDTDVTEVIFNHYFAIAEIIAEVLTKSQTTDNITRQHQPLHLAHLILSTLHGLVAVKGAKPSYDYIEPIKQIILSLLKP